MPISRETASSDSPRNSRMTISRLRVALQRWMTLGPAFSPGPVGSFGLFFGFSIGPSIWTIRCPTSSTADHAEVIRDSAEALLGIINDVLDISKLEAGKIELETIDFPLDNLVRGVVE